MAKFHEVIDSLGYGDDGITTAYPETFTTDIMAAYDEDMSIPTAAVDVLKADLAAAQAEIVRLKAHNYELITATPVDDQGADDNQDDDNSDSDDEESSDGVDGLFGNDDNDK